MWPSWRKSESPALWPKVSLNGLNLSRVDLLCHHFVNDAQAGYLCVPLIVPSGTNGLLCLTGAVGKMIGTSARQRLAVTAGQTIKQCLYSLRLRDDLRDQATHDLLTGMCNRRSRQSSLSSTIRIVLMPRNRGQAAIVPVPYHQLGQSPSLAIDETET